MGTIRLFIFGTLLKGSLVLDEERVGFSAESPVLGRGPDCEIRIDSTAHCIARRHVQFDHLDGVIRIRDLRSSQGIFVNREHIPTETPWPLRDGDVVHIGVRDFLIRID